jgi:putative nucleotidyltransferase with HDIG domain
MKEIINPSHLSVPDSSMITQTTINRLGALQTLGKVINRHLDLHSLLEAVIEIVFSELKADNGSVWILDNAKDELKNAAARGLPPQAIEKNIAVGDGIAGRVAATGKPLLIQGSATPSQRSAGSRPTSSICAPILIHEQVHGVICVNILGDHRSFSYKDLQMLQIMASQTGTAIDNVTLMDGLKANNYAIVRSLGEAVEAKDPYTAGHCEYVSRYSVAIAQAMNLPLRDIEEIKIGAILHDVGKIGISEEILGKQSKLTAEEFEIMKKHPIHSARIVAPLHLPKNCLQVIKYHHERPDGKGYPYGLVDEEIYIGAKIVMVADTFDAITSHRPYREGKPKEVAIEEILRYSGSQFDPQVAETFINILPQMNKSGVLRSHLLEGKREKVSQEVIDQNNKIYKIV